MIRRILLSLLMLSVFLQASAMLQLELTQGVSSAIPLAIIPFSGDAVKGPNQQTVADVIQNDLQNSGEFRVVGPEGITKRSASLADVDYAYWQKQKIDNVLIGTVEPVFAGRYRVTIQLLSTYRTKNTNNVLINESFTTDQSGLRQLAHHISDLIYQKLTGVRGVFSTKIAYILVQRPPNKAARYSLEVSDADGFNPQTLLTSSEPIMSPTWSPDGKHVAYVSFEGHRATIYIQDLATGEREAVSEAPGVNGAPAFSPDGSKMALVLSKTGNPNLYLLDLNTHQLTPLTKDWSIDTEPAFSPDGKTLLFTSNRDGSPQIYQLDLSSGAVTRLTYSGNYNARAFFLPDEKGIIMMHREGGLFGIARQDFETGRTDVLVQTGADESPSLAPNGKMIIYATQYGGRGVLAQVATNGQVKLRLPAREGTVQEPAWSPYL